VTEGSQLAYIRRRLLEERHMAEAALCEDSRAVHARMSRLYEARLTLTHVDQANSAVIEKSDSTAPKSRSAAPAKSRAPNHGSH
jgi:hypothetical protein